MAVAGWTVDLVDSRGLGTSARDLTAHADLVLLTVSDGAIAEVSRRLADTGEDSEGVVAHVSGACGLDVLAPHRRVGSLHPLMSLPDAEIGGRRLRDSCTFAVDGDSAMEGVVTSLGGRAVRVPAENRSLYHATATIAANHLTALCDQVERLAAAVGVPADAYWTLMDTTLQNVASTGAASALTGPAARADWDTIRSHLAALPADERSLYLALCQRAARLAGHNLADDLTGMTR